MTAHDVREDVDRAASTDRVVFSVRSYGEAAAAIERLAEKDFPVERATIVGRGHRLVEQVVGRRGPLQAAGEGALVGAAIGGLTGIVFGLFTVVEAGLGLGLLIWGIVTGAVLGAVLGLLGEVFSGRRRFESLSSLASDRYDVVLDEPVADEGARLLNEWTRFDGPRTDSRDVTDTVRPTERRER